MSSHVIRPRPDRRTSILFQLGNQRLCRFSRYFCACGDQRVRGNSSHKWRFIMDGLTDECAGGTGPWNIARGQFRKTSSDAIHLVDPNPFKADRPDRPARHQALIGDGPDGWRDCGGGKFGKVLVDTRISEAMAKPGCQRPGRTLAELQGEGGHDVLSLEYVIEQSWFAGPAAPCVSAIQQIRCCGCRVCDRDTREHTFGTTLRRLADRTNPVIQPPGQRSKEEGRRRRVIDAVEGGFSEMAIAVKQKEPGIVTIEFEQLAVRRHPPRLRFEQLQEPPPSGARAAGHDDAPG